MKEIPIFIKSTKEIVYALVDNDDYEMVVLKEWEVKRDRKGKYLAVKLKNRGMSLHQFILLINKKPVPKSSVIDHINRNPLDNRIENLRAVPPQRNAWNTGPMSNKTTSKHKGVHFNKHLQRWIASIYINGKPKRLGSFATELQEAQTYNKAVKENRGGNIFLNNVPEPEGEILTLGQIAKLKKASKYNGVYRYNHSQKWMAIIHIKQKPEYVGSFPTELEAAQIYNKAAKELFGERARLNNVPEPQGEILTLGQRRELKKTSKYIGVCRYKNSKKWAAGITMSGKHKHLGVYPTEHEALLAYNRAKYLNDIPDFKSKTSSKYIGVCFDKRSQHWVALIAKNGKDKHLGSYRTELEAAQAYNKAAKELFKERARLNDVPEPEGEILSLGQLRKLKQYSKFRGVSFHKLTQRWVAYIPINGKRKDLGSFATELEAAQTVKKTLKEYGIEDESLKGIPESEGELLSLGEIRKSKQSSKHRGVYRHKQSGKWIAEKWVNGKTHYLGIFNSEEEAVKASEEANKKYSRM